MKNSSLFREFLEYRQLLAAEELFKPKDDKKKDEKKPWHAAINPTTFLKIYILMVILYPVIGKAYTSLLLKIWQ